MTDCKKGEYVVLLSSCDGQNCWKNSMPENYCYKLKEDSYIDYFIIELDTKGSSTNGWTCNKEFDSKLNLRYATTKEIAKYDKLGNPFKVTNKKVKPEDYNYLISLFKKLGIK